MAAAAIATMPTTMSVSSIVTQELRSAPRIRTSDRILASPIGPEFKEEVQITENNSRNGLYFTTQSQHYRVGTPISIRVPLVSGQRSGSQWYGKVVRVDGLEGGWLGIAVQVLMR